MNVFIDLGSHHGAILRKFVASKSYTPDFTLHAFEANPSIKEITFSTYPHGTIIYRKAAWVKDCKLDFYLSDVNCAAAQGSSLIKEKITGELNIDAPVVVEAIDFSFWLSERFTEADNVIVKCNIEGAEYPVFNKIMDDKNMGIIKKLILKRHWSKIKMSPLEDANFFERLSSYRHLEVTNKYEF